MIGVDYEDVGGGNILGKKNKKSFVSVGRWLRDGGRWSVIRCRVTPWCDPDWRHSRPYRQAVGTRVGWLRHYTGYARPDGRSDGPWHIPTAEDGATYRAFIKEQ